jgi:SAM-dependent methyltransferase
MPLSLTPALIDSLPTTGPTDPIRYYRRPLIGQLFNRRINLGLGLLGDLRFRRALEVGYAAGAVQLVLAQVTDDLHGIDLDTDAVEATARLSRAGVKATLKQGDVLALPYEDAHFDLVVSFSTLEHIREYEKALREIHRVISPGGLFLLGMPRVDRVMEVGFLAIGFRSINHHHITTPGDVEAAFPRVGFTVEDRAPLGLPGFALYHNWLLRKV